MLLPRGPKGVTFFPQAKFRIIYLSDPSYQSMHCQRKRSLLPVINVIMWGLLAAWQAESIPAHGEEDVSLLPPVSSAGEVLAPLPEASLLAGYGGGQNRPEPTASQPGSEKGPSEPDAATHGTDTASADNADADNQEQTDNQEEEEEKPSRLLGDWLHGRGPVAFEYIYTGEILSNTRGGLRTRRATRYEGLFDLTMDVELEKIRPRLPGKVYLLFQHTHGRGLSLDFVGDAQMIRNYLKTSMRCSGGGGGETTAERRPVGSAQGS